MTITRHPHWCAGGHACHLGEHRAAPITFTVPGAGSAVLTRVQSPDGTGHAEVRISVSLPKAEPYARYRLAALLFHLRTLVGPPRPTRARRAA